MYHNVSDTLCINYEMKYTLIASGASIICTVGATMFACVRELPYNGSRSREGRKREENRS